jgi:adenylyl-sulfate kinase
MGVNPNSLLMGFAVWLTGLPSSGKTTLAGLLAKELLRIGLKVEVLDADVIRPLLWPELGYSREDRNENVRRLSILAQMLVRSGLVTVVAAISPYRDGRASARSQIGPFVEVYLDCPVEECIRRDSRGLYRRALTGEIPRFTGVSDPYEPPETAEVVVMTDRESPGASVERIIEALTRLGFISPSPA